MKKVYQLLVVAMICLMLFSCTAGRVMYAPARITVNGGKVTIQPKDKFRTMPDTTIDAIIIRRNK